MNPIYTTYRSVNIEALYTDDLIKGFAAGFPNPDNASRTVHLYDESLEGLYAKIDEVLDGVSN